MNAEAPFGARWLLRDDDVNRPGFGGGSGVAPGSMESAGRSLSTEVGQLHGSPGATKYHEQSQKDHNNWDDRGLGL